MDLTDVLTKIGIFLGGGLLAFISFIYNAKPKKNSIEIENMKAAMGKLQDVINQLSETNDAYRKETDATIKELKEEMADMRMRLDIKHEAIYAAERCSKITDTNECIVMKTFKQKCQQFGLSKTN